MSVWRYIAQNLLTGEWLHTDLPLREVEIETELSGPGGIRAFVAPETLALRTDSGARLLDEWSTAIYAEASGQIRGAGILVRSTGADDGETWKLECPGFSTYPHGSPFTGVFTKWRPDPFDLVRDIWKHLQVDNIDGDIGMIVSSKPSGLAVGDVKPPPRPKYVSQALKAPTKGSKPRQGKGESEIDWLGRVDLWEQDYASRLLVYKSTKEKKDTNKQKLSAAQSEWDKQYGQRKPYELFSWEAPDCGKEIDDLSTEAGFDYLERHEWKNADRLEIAHHLDLEHPMIGRRRPDLRFAAGENMLVIPDTERDGDAYSNEVIGLGKGDGRDMLQTRVSARDGRLRRASVLSEKGVGNKSRLRALADRERKMRSVLERINEIVVWDHPNAPVGSFNVGDEIFAESVHGWFPLRTWCRIVALRVYPEDESKISLTVVSSERIM